MDNQAYASEVTAERRHYKRKPLHLRLEFRMAEDADRAEASVSASENLSAGGLAIQTEKFMKKGQELRLVLFIPPKEKRADDRAFNEVPAAECLQIRIRAQIVWKLPFLRDRFLYGLKFKQIEPADTEIYQDFLKEFYLVKPYLVSDQDSLS